MKYRSIFLHSRIALLVFLSWLFVPVVASTPQTTQMPMPAKNITACQAKKSNYQITITNATDHDVNSFVTVNIFDKTSLLLASISQQINIQRSAHASYSICATWYNHTTKHPSLEIVPGSACTNVTAPDGSQVIPLTSTWTGTALPNTYSFDSFSPQINSPNGTLVFNRLSGTIDATQSTELPVGSIQGLHSVKFTLTNTNPNNTGASDRFSLAISGTAFSFPGSVNELTVYTKDPVKNAILTGTDTSRAFLQLVFMNEQGDWASSLPLDITPDPSGSTTSAIKYQSKAITMPDIQLPGWPNYIAMGSVANFSNDQEIKKRGDADAIFKYAGNDGGGDNGKDPVALFYNTAKAVIKTTNLAESLSVVHKPVIPVMVVYTTNASGGNQKEAEDQVNNLPLLTQHLSYLAITAAYLNNHPISKGVYGSLVINPDTYGEGNKDGFYKNVTPPIFAGLNAMLDYLSSQTNPDTHKPFITSDKKAQLQDSIKTLFENKALNFKIYNQALNWIMHVFGPNVTYGFADNVWAGDNSGHSWLHKAYANPAAINQHIQAEATYLINNGVYGNPPAYHNPSFIAFDKYERNTFVYPDHPLANYFYNARDWAVYMKYVSGVSNTITQVMKQNTTLTANQALPVMLFQIPGGHIPAKTDIHWQYGATAPDYLLGDTAICTPDKLSDNGLQVLSYKLDSSYGVNNTSQYPLYSKYLFATLLANNYDNIHNNGCLWGGHMAQAIQDHVFAILWGGGSTTSIAGPQDDGGALSHLIDHYMNRPYNLQGNIIARPYPLPGH